MDKEGGKIDLRGQGGWGKEGIIREDLKDSLGGYHYLQT